MYILGQKNNNNKTTTFIPLLVQIHCPVWTHLIQLPTTKKKGEGKTFFLATAGKRGHGCPYSICSLVCIFCSSNVKCDRQAFSKSSISTKTRLLCVLCYTYCPFTPTQCGCFFFSFLFCFVVLLHFWSERRTTQTHTHTHTRRGRERKQCKVLHEDIVFF